MSPFAGTKATGATAAVLCRPPGPSPIEAAALDAFVRHLPQHIRDAVDENAYEWPPRLAVMLEKAHQAWPGVHVAEPDYLAYVAQRVFSGPVGRALGEMCTSDLYLACACAHGDRKALAAFQKTFGSHIRAAVAVLDPSGDLGDDVLQVLCMRLFVATENRLPKVTGYRGKGNLKTWLRAAALRTALNLRRKGAREVPDVPAEENALAYVADAKANPERAYLEETFNAELQIAFGAAVATLTRRERALLRDQFLDGMSIDRIAALHSVHRATAARWLVKARAALVKTCRRLLAQRLRIAVLELDDVIAPIESRFFLGLSGVLRQAGL